MDPEKPSQDVINAKGVARQKYLGVELPRGVVGIGVGRKVINGVSAGEWCVRLYVQAKIAKAGSLTTDDRLPEKIEGIPTDVIEAGVFKVLAGSAGGSVAEVGPGSSIGYSVKDTNLNPMVGGTLGAVVKDRDGVEYVLGNNHVLAINGRVPLNGRIVSPALTDRPASKPDRQIAERKGFVQLQRDEPNYADLALARISEGVVIDPSFPKIGALTSEKPADPVIGREVAKVGNATNLTEGTIVDVSADFFLDYSFGTFEFRNQILIEGDGHPDFATDGDSGAVVVDLKTRQATALVFARALGLTAASPLVQVFEKLGLSLVTTRIAQAQALPQRKRAARKYRK